jgi:hypothetical protein
MLATGKVGELGEILTFDLIFTDSETVEQNIVLVARIVLQVQALGNTMHETLCKLFSAINVINANELKRFKCI